MAQAVLTSSEPTINVKTMQRVISEIVIEQRQVVMFRGPAGIGKTFGIRQGALQSNAFLCEVRLGQYDSVDMRGFPGVDQTTGLTVWHAPSTLPFVGNDAFPDDVPILLFLDELTSASPPVFAVCYQLLQDFAIGEHKLKPNVRICCAGNNDSDRGVVNRMPAPLNNRMLHFQVAVDVPMWCDYMLGRYAPQFVAYHRWKKNSLLKWDPDAVEPPPCIPTPRSWEAAAKIYDRYHAADIDFMRLNMAAAIGEGETTEFMAFLSVWTKVLSIKDIIKDPRGVPLPDEESLTYATAVSVSGSMDLTNVKPLHTFLQRLAPEYVVMAWSLALSRNEALYTSDEFLDVGERYKAIFSTHSTKKAA